MMILRIVCKQECKQTINVLYGRPDIMWVSIFVYYVFIYIERKINKIEFWWGRRDVSVRCEYWSSHICLKALSSTFLHLKTILRVQFDTIQAEFPSISIEASSIPPPQQTIITVEFTSYYLLSDNNVSRM